MGTLLIALGAMVFYWVAYHTYGRWLAKKLFHLDDRANVPSRELQDDEDYVPTDKYVVFGHHFTSIAGTGPIVGPAIAVMWGWVPALLWVLFGSVLMGAVHDFGSLVISMRNRGQTMGDIAGRIITPRVRILFLSILFMALTIVLAIFGLVIAAVFRQYPSSIMPCMLQIPIAVAIGFIIHRKGQNLLIPSLVALGLMYVTVFYGNWGPLASLNQTMANWPVMTWVVILLVYSYVASVLPVWSLLQPRDYINSLQLITALGLVVLGLVVAGIFGGTPVSAQGTRTTLQIAAPAFQWNPQGAPAIFPFLFITVACGAISGFHCLVSSGTSSKQLKQESDAQFVGYGSMLVEGYLAVIVILACVAGLSLGVKSGGTILTGQEAWLSRYGSWATASGLEANISAFVDGSANFLHAMGIPVSAAVALIGVLVASFAGTTMDTACRLQRYVIQELASTLRGTSYGHTKVTLHPLSWLQDKHGASIFAILLAGIMAGLPIKGEAWTWASSGKGGLILWPMFGAVNQLLGGLAFLVIVFWLLRRKLPIALALLPMIFMLVMPAWALILQLSTWLQTTNTPWVLVGFTIATLLLEVWMVVEGVILWPKAKGLLESPLPPLQTANP